MDHLVVPDMSLHYRTLNCNVLLVSVVIWNALGHFHQMLRLHSTSNEMLQIRHRSNHWRCSVKKRCSLKFCNIHSKTPVLESLFNKVAGLRPSTLLKRSSNTGVFTWILRNFLRTPILKNICKRLLLYTVVYNKQSPIELIIEPLQSLHR